MARQKTVFANGMVAHVWAQQTQDEGRSSNGNFYFIGPRLYSYGRHFVAGFITQAVDGSKVTLLNSHNYSMSTAKHLNYARRAVSGLVFSVECPDVEKNGRDAVRNTHLANLAALQKAVADERGRLSRARKYKDEWRLNSLSEHATRYAIAFGLEGIADAALELTNVNEADRIARHVAAIEQYRGQLDAGRHNGMTLREASRLVDYIQDRLRNANAIPAWKPAPLTAYEQAILDRSYSPMMQAARRTGDGLRIMVDRLGSFETREEAAALYPECLARWRDGVAFGEGVAKDYSSKTWREVFALMRAGGQLLRVSKDGQNIETSDHATFPVDHAVRAFHIIAAIRASGKEWTRGDTGPRLGHFTIDRVDAQGNVKAGCHNVRWPEIERCARQLGLLDAVAA